ncbi:MAG: protein phosphatase 1 regulatory subunit 42 [Cellvibrionaceae bacterium]|nr:protein phosphatase 1 regulatory subunit 42 [Cellvibrionaceae bacterium]
MTNNTPAIRFILAAGGLMLLTACNGYRLTLNEAPVNDERRIFSAYSMQDKALSKCVASVLDDRGSQHAGQLTQLNCSHEGVASLAGLQIFSQLRHLDLSNNRLADVRVLEQLEMLEVIDLRKNAELSCQQIEQLRAASKAKIKADQCDN